MGRRYTKEDVDTHADGFYGPSLPAVNVKVYEGLESVSFPLDDADAPELTLEWIEEHMSEEDLSWLFGHTCENEWEMIQQDAQTIFSDYTVTVEAQGRSGGWACVKGLPDIEEWDAVLLAKWRKFERFARQIAAGVPEQMAYSIALNEYACWEEEQTEESGLHRDPITA